MVETPEAETISQRGFIKGHPRISSIAAGTGLLVGALGINFLADKALESMPADLAIEAIRGVIKLGIFFAVVKAGTPLLRTAGQNKKV
jgi:hypothetical protein